MSAESLSICRPRSAPTTSPTPSSSALTIEAYTRTRSLSVAGYRPIVVGAAASGRRGAVHDTQRKSGWLGALAMTRVASAEISVVVYSSSRSGLPFRCQQPCTSSGAHPSRRQ